MGVVGLGGGPALLRVPVVLVDAMNELLLIRNDGEKVGEESGVPDPLADVDTARSEPRMLKRRLCGLHAAKDAVLVDIDSEAEHGGIVGVKQRLENLLDLRPRQCGPKPLLSRG